MLKEWQFNVLFFVGVGGAILLLLGPEAGIHVSQNPTAVTGVGAILTYVLTQKKALTKKEHREEKSEGEGEDKIFAPIAEEEAELEESEERHRRRSEKRDEKKHRKNEEEAR